MSQESKLTLEEIGLAVVRIEGKLDLLSSRQEDAAKQSVDHEARLRYLEQKSVVTPKVLWSSILGASTIVGVVSQVIYVATQK